MNLAFYNAATGASQQQQRLNVIGNNVANVNTYGFKAKSPAFSSLMYSNLNGIDNAQLPQGSGAFMSSANTNFSDGAAVPTGRSQDYAISGYGFFALYDPYQDEISYTRDGSFTTSGFQRETAEGTLEQVFYLSDGDGRFVLNEEGNPIEVFDFAEPQAIGIYTFANTDGMRSAGGNRFLPVEKNGPPMLMEDAIVKQGMLESSNADLAKELTKLIEAQRVYSYALRMVTTSDEVTTTVNGLRNT